MVLPVYTIDEAFEKKEIVRRYRNLLKVWHTKDREAKKLVRRAFDLAVDAHRDMRRKTGEPYIFHPLEVATIVSGEIGLGTTSIVSALLHDVVEDTEYTLEDIRSQFGDQVTRIIDGLTKIQEIFELTSASPQAENFRKILLTLSEDIRVILIKLADRLHNMRTLEALPKDKQLKISSETLYLFAPLAHRLGLHAIKSELEDLALKFTEPEIYQTIQLKLKESRLDRLRFINKFIYPIKRDLSTRGMKFTIHTREKNVFSIWNKMKNKEIPFEEVFDLFAVRIVIDVPPEEEKAECWRVYSIITDYYRPKQDRLRDWITNPKANGYEALHTTVMSQTGRWVELQIRSKRMDEIAEKGYAAHWKYKENVNSETGLEEWLSKIRDLLADNDSDALDFLSDFKLNLFADEIFVFTPRGDVKTLPAGATTLDFAYAIHTDIGNSSIGAKVNHALVPLNHVLKSGDQVEIIASDNQSPKEEWLQYVVTARAKTQIKLAIKEEKKKMAGLGRQKLEAYFTRYELPNNRATLNRLLETLKISSPAELYVMMARDEVGEKEIREFSHAGEQKKWLTYLSRPFIRVKPASIRNINETIVEQLKKKPESLLLSDDINDIKYTVARCCSPIPGDDVIGYQNERDAIEIHRTNCPEAINLMSRYSNRIIKAKWNYKESVGFLTGIRIQGIDRKGLIRRITEVISEKHNINIRSFHLDTSEGMTEGTIMLYVHDTDSLHEMMKNLMNLKEIVKVARLDRLD
jgi:GTP pyrophosphokinase